MALDLFDFRCGILRERLVESDSTHTSQVQGTSLFCSMLGLYDNDFSTGLLLPLTACRAMTPLVSATRSLAASGTRHFSTSLTCCTIATTTKMLRLSLCCCRQAKYHTHFPVVDVICVLYHSRQHGTPRSTLRAPSAAIFNEPCDSTAQMSVFRRSLILSMQFISARQFHKIRQELYPNRSVREIIEYFYHWKSSRDYTPSRRAVKRQKPMSELDILFRFIFSAGPQKQADGSPGGVL